MKKQIVILVLLMGLFLVSCQNQPATLTESQKSEIEKQIRDISQKWLVLWNNNDAEGIVNAFIADNATLFSVNMEPAAGKDSIRNRYAGFIKNNPTKVSSWATDRVEVSSSGDMAIEYGHYSDSGMGMDGTGSDKGNYVTVFRKINGEWKVISDISASSKPAAPAK